MSSRCKIVPFIIRLLFLVSVLRLLTVLPASAQHLQHFLPKVDYATGFSPVAIAVADLNDDGYVDIVTSSPLSVLLGKGDGSFQPHTDYVIPGEANSIAIGDFNGDGDGTFQAPRHFRTGTEPFAVAIADFNGDGAPDLATPNFLENSVSILLKRIGRSSVP